MKAKKLVCIATAAVMTATMAAIFAGCNGDGDDKLTVTWYDGRETLKTQEVDSGSKLTEWTPAKDGYEFKGWFAESSKTQKFDFSKAITEDTSVYSSWLKVEYVEDTNEYYLVGAGSGDMSVSNWDQTTAKEGLALVKDTTITNKNVYSVTITLYAGDQFQICHGGAWDGQMGIGAVAGATQNENAAPEDANYYEAKNDQGVVVFCGSKGFGDNPVGWNAVLAEGQDGKYKITLTTYPGQEANNVITWELVQKLEPLAETHKMYIIGGMNNWDSEHPENLIAMTKGDGNIWTGFFTTEAAVEFKVFNSIGSVWIGPGPTDNYKAETAGTYCVTYDQAANTAQFAKCEYYVVGTFLDGENAVNFSVKDGVTPKMTTADNGATYTVTFTAADVTDNGSYSWMKDQGKPGVCAIKVVLGCELGIKDWYSAEGGDNFYLTAGEHTVTFTVDGGAVTVS